ncbi:TolB family protein [Pseudoalteromonas denitrificans]|uniref:WD40-like Beta Propeller Repeat n=1 Tax=Pseudoalteromonas denitrificans DSM 6059 TaxID=1123010 RepID=A0A1I1RTL9_9GAMM|nr:PD40 domain-containing protein [Pseudoalteromonas denitrificans]SFD37694.1 WD40-like Beta Propeller Repeat [Pseudoalteromonas denitrificans DSM 6059]
MRIKIFLLVMFLWAQTASSTLVSQLSSEQNDYSFNISSRYNLAVFARSDKNFKNATIWQTKITKNAHFEPPEMVVLGPREYSYSDPMLTADGETLLFVSDLPLNSQDKSNDYNIWQASWHKSKWQNIQPLPANINSDSDEFGPELHNGVLYFSSFRNGKLSLYQSNTITKAARVTPYQYIQHKRLSQSDITFSPDSNIALFWQRSKDKKDTILMMQRRTNKVWGKPIQMPASIQSKGEEFSPQFSPDGQWLYISSNRQTNQDKQFNIHKFATKNVFPSAWYQAHLAQVDISILANKKHMMSVRSFEYDLEIEQQETKVKEHIKISFNPFQISKIKEGHSYWTDGNSGYKQKTSGKKTTLTQAEIIRLQQTARYNFIYMFKHNKTKLFKQYAIKDETNQLYRVHAEGLNPFSILITQKKSNQTNTIKQLRYDDLAMGLEQDYQKIKGIYWPMKFEFLVNNKTIAKGQFSNIKIE